MHVRRRFRLLLGIQFAMAISLGFLTTALFWNQRSLSRAQRVHFRSYQLADELRQSSDDLTRLARAFVATGELEFEHQYRAVLDIRDGRIPRPADYHRIYWDLVTKDQPKPRPDGAMVSLHALMLQEGFTVAEFAKLSSAREHSDKLVQVERIALNAAKGKFDDGTGGFTLTRAPDRAWATRLLNDEAYQEYKKLIMRPIDDFYAMFAQRTAGEVARLERRSLALLWASGGVITAILGLFVFSFVTLWRQMTEREQAEAARMENDARIRLLGDNLPGGMIYQLDMGPDGKERRFNYVSAGVEKLHGVSVETIREDAAVLYRQIVPEDRPTVAAREAEALAQMKPFQAEIRSHLPSGQIRWSLLTSAPRRAADGRVLWDGIELDITDRKAADEAVRASEERYRLLNGELEERVTLRTAELAARNREIETLLAREHELSGMKSQFITVASHEFRTPLAAAVGSLDLLERHAGRLPEAKRNELLKRIQDSLGRLTSIMNDMVMLTRVDSGQLKVNRMAVDLGQFVRDLVDSAKTNDRQQHAFSFQQTGRSDVAFTDTSLLHHIISNLIKNAVLYSPAGSKIDVALAVGPRDFSLSVADEGIGIPPAERERIFEPFVRGSNIGQIGGTGLGLNIVKRYVELLGGRIELLPATAGTTFLVNIPLQQPNP